MSRALKHANQVVPAGTSVDVFTVPADHKYEVITIGFAATTSAAYAANVLAQYGGTFWPQDRVVVAACGFYTARNYNALVFDAGEILTIFASAGAVGGLGVTVHYVDVDLS